jgi:hypothetical protein
MRTWLTPITGDRCLSLGEFLDSCGEKDFSQESIYAKELCDPVETPPSPYMQAFLRQIAADREVMAATRLDDEVAHLLP